MKQLLVINPHSFVDVITNSSTELFVCDTDKSLEMVKKLLEEQWAEFIKSNKFQYEYVDDDGKRVQIKNPTDVWDILNVRVGLTEEEKADKDGKSKWGGWGYEGLVQKNTIVIKGNDDNSIPWEFNEIIEEIFNAKRWHLG